MKDKTLTDIMLICKGWYNKEKYHNSLEAMNAYYHKNYGCEDIEMNKSFAMKLFLTPLVLEAIKVNPSLATYIFDSPSDFLTISTDYTEVMYHRLISLIELIPHGTFDLSDYEEMFASAGVIEDKTIGII